MSSSGTRPCSPGVSPPWGCPGRPADRLPRGRRPKLGAQLIGKLEGPELILDPAKWPTKFSEAPMLAELVKQGKLPPVDGAHPEGAARHQAGPRDRPVRRDLAARLHGPRRQRERQPHRVGRQAPVLGVHGHPAPAVRRAPVAPERRREVGDALPAQGSQVVGREALHRRRLRVLVRGRLPEQGHRADAASRLPDQRQVRGHQEDRRDDGRVRVPRAELPLPRHPGRLDGHGRRSGALADGGPDDGRLHAGALHQAVPSEVHRDGRGGRQGEGGQLRHLARPTSRIAGTGGSTPSCRC